MRDPRQSPRVGDIVYNPTMHPATRQVTAIDSAGIEYSPDLMDARSKFHMTHAQWRKFAQGSEIVKRARG